MLETYTPKLLCCAVARSHQADWWHKHVPSEGTNSQARSEWTPPMCRTSNWHRQWLHDQGYIIEKNVDRVLMKTCYDSCNRHRVTIMYRIVLGQLPMIPNTHWNCKIVQSKTRPIDNSHRPYICNGHKMAGRDRCPGRPSIEMVEQKCKRSRWSEIHHVIVIIELR